MNNSILDIEVRLRRAERQGRISSVTALLALLAAFALSTRSPASAKNASSQMEAEITALHTTVAAQQNRLDVFDKLPFRLDGTNLWIEHVNVHIVDGGMKTISSSGLGNLIIGYNEPGGPRDIKIGRERAAQDQVILHKVDVRDGSHNLVLGSLNNYHGSGGIICGRDNQSDGNYACIIGGASNTISKGSFDIDDADGGPRIHHDYRGDFSVIVGGINNLVNCDSSAIFNGKRDTCHSVNCAIFGGADSIIYADTSNGGDRVVLGGPAAWNRGPNVIIAPTHLP